MGERIFRHELAVRLKLSALMKCLNKKDREHADEQRDETADNPGRNFQHKHYTYPLLSKSSISTLKGDNAFRSAARS